MRKVFTSKSVSSLVGDEYKEWLPKEKILISTPTGSGKTTFVLETLLPFAAEQNNCVVYMCNRVALSRQVQSKINAITSHKEALKILMYQKAETRGVNTALCDIEPEQSKIKYIVFDEAHYFLHDASFNSNIDCWREFIKNYKGEAALIFLTATPDEFLLFINSIEQKKDPQSLYEILEARKEIKLLRYPKVELDLLKRGKVLTFPRLRKNPFICEPGEQSILIDQKEIAKYDVENKKECKRVYNYYSNIDVFKDLNQTLEDLVCNNSIRHYDYTPLYDNVTVRYFKSEKDIDNDSESEATKYDALIPLIISPDQCGKWLIFVSNKDEGQALSKRINELSADPYYSKYIDSRAKAKKHGVFKQIAEEEFFSCKVLISTSVIDNGVNINDDKVKNIVLSTIDKTAFMQMLGRKRVNNSSKINLYIMHHSLRELRYLQLRNLQKLQLVDQFIAMNQKKETLYFDPFVTSASNDSERGFNVSEYLKNGVWTVAMRMHMRIKFTDNATARLFHERTLLSASMDYRSGFNQIFKPISTDKNALIGSENTQAYSSSTLLRNYEINNSALLKLLYDANNLNSAIRAIKRYDLKTDKVIIERNAFLKTQLSWIKKDYDEAAWVLDERKLEAERVLNIKRHEVEVSLIAKLKKQCRAPSIKTIAEKEEFILSCFSLLNDANMLPPNHKNDLSRYERGHATPGQAKLNNALKHNGIPYAIKTWQIMKTGKKKTCWKIVERVYDDDNFEH